MRRVLSRASARTLSSRRGCSTASDDPFQNLFPELAGLSEDRFKVAAGHFHLILEDGWQPETHKWEFSKDLSDNLFTASGHQWVVDFELTRRASLDSETNSMTGGTFRRYTLRRLTRGHPLPIKVVSVLTDKNGATRQAEELFYTPLQQQDGIVSENFEIMRVAETDSDVKEGEIDVQNLVSIEVTVQVYPRAIPQLVDMLYQQHANSA
eukprot:TRINITY_DN3510_c3_g1_i1.p1 TRINITY_DN3510_c3_g1~~TRINITY_DN3510_c3_g1_i1.p1  ORF type:complete len:221 (+),score=35.60 TRINITY_DN3510_c3_g1_i1:37-663(+)